MRLIKDSKKTMPADYLLNGFKNNKKFALLIEPLNEREWEFSKGFYNIIESEYDMPIIENIQEDRYPKSIIENIIEDEVKEKIKRLYHGQIDRINERFSYKVNGDESNIKELEIYIERFQDDGETHSIGFILDITNERLKRLELEEENKNKNILIKEAHHRVKNNLQILNSFLNLERRAYENEPEVIIDHMQSRLNSLALLHERSYNSNDFRKIDLKDYILEQDEYLKNLIGKNGDVKFITEVEEDIELSIDVITPLLLMIDEITMNALKHAFSNDDDKRITKEIKRIEGNKCQLTIRDNGKGIDFNNFPKKNLGWEIIRSLVKQIDGEMELLNQNIGTCYRIIFPIDRN